MCQGKQALNSCQTTILEDYSRISPDPIFQIKITAPLVPCLLCHPADWEGSDGVSITEPEARPLARKWHDIHGPMQLCGGIISHKTRRGEDTGTLLTIASAAFHQEGGGGMRDLLYMHTCGKCDAL